MDNILSSSSSEKQFDYLSDGEISQSDSASSKSDTEVSSRRSSTISNAVDRTASQTIASTSTSVIPSYYSSEENLGDFSSFPHSVLNEIAQCTENILSFSISSPSIQQILFENKKAQTFSSDQLIAYYPRMPFLKHIKLTKIPNLNDLKQLQHFKYLNSLDLSACTDSENQNIESGVIMQIVEIVPNLTSLNLTGCKKTTDEAIKSLKNLKYLEELVLNDCIKITNQGCKYIGEMTQLKKLGIGGCYLLENEGFEHIKGLSRLAELNLANSLNLVDQHLEEPGNWSALTHLNLSNCTRLNWTGKLHQHLSSFQNLIHLDLSYILFSDTLFLQNFNHLTHLSIRHNTHSQLFASDIINSVKNLDHLKHLDTRDCFSHDRRFSEMSQIKSGLRGKIEELLTN